METDILLYIGVDVYFGRSVVLLLGQHARRAPLYDGGGATIHREGSAHVRGKGEPHKIKVLLLELKANKM